MNDRATTPASYFQFSLRQLFLWITVVAAVCGPGLARFDYLPHVEAKNGSIPPETVSVSLFLAFLLVTTLLGLMIGPPFCVLLALLRSRRPDATCEKSPRL